MERQRVLIVHNYYQKPGGEDTVVANEKRLLEEHGHEVELYTRNNNEIKSLSVVHKLLLPFIVMFNYRTYREIRKLIKRKRIDIVHVHNTLSLISPSVYYAAKSCRVPVVQTIHNFRLLCPGAVFYRERHICEDCLEYGLRCAVKNKCYRGSRLQTLACVINTKVHRMTGIYRGLNYICLTEFTRNKLLHLKGIDLEKVYIKPNFAFEYEEEDTADDYYVFVGRIEEIKGVKMLVEAFSLMPCRKLKMVGSGELDREIAEKLEREGIENIEMLGYRPQQDVQKLVGKAKGLIMCSKWYEGFPMAIVEAFSVGTPVIVGDIGNMRELVKPGKTGERFIYNSPESLVEALDRFEAGDTEKYRKNAYDFYRKYLSPEVNYRELIEIYKAVLDE